MQVQFLRTEMLPGKKIAGKKMEFSLIQNRTPELWRSFIPLAANLKNRKNKELISLQIVPAGYYENFSPANVFEKWAAAEVLDFSDVSAEFEAFEIPEGLYAVFHYKGSSAEGAKLFGYIFGEWLPASDYVFDYRPQFEILGDLYRNNDPESEEEIWIPVSPK